MKKIFLFAAALVAAVSMNAQEILAPTAESDFTIANAAKNSGSTETKLIYDMTTVGSAVTFTYGNIVASINNTQEVKTKIFTVALGDYVEFGGKNGVLDINNLTVGATVEIVMANKSDKGDGEISATAGAAETAAVTLPKKVAKDATDKPAGADDNGYTWVTAKFTAIASTMTLKEVSYGYRFAKITITSPTAIENNEAEVKAVKMIENGQVVIIKNGVKYNVLGAEIK